MQIVISEDRLTAMVGEEKLVVGGPVTFKNVYYWVARKISRNRN